MKKLALFLAALVFAAPTFAKDDKGRGQEKEKRGHGSSHSKGDDDDDHDKGRGNDKDRGASAWAPKPVTREDKRGIDAYYRKLDEAWEKRDLQTVTRNIDFPILMVTDDARGEGTAAYWSRDQYLREMNQAMGGMPEMQTKSRRKPFFITNDLVVVEVENEARMGPRKFRYRSADILIRKNGEWVSKASIEGGWGDSASTSAPQQGQPGGTFVPGGNPNTPKDNTATAPGGTPNTNQPKPGGTAVTTPNPKDTSGGMGDSKGGATTPTTQKDTSGGQGDTKGASAPTTPTGKGTAGSSGGKLSAPQQSPDAGTPVPPGTKGSAKGATMQK